MTNREMLDRMSNKELANFFCYDIAKDGEYCTRCPFTELCNHGDSGFEVWLGKECEVE